MEKFTVLTGLVAPLDRANVDTDQIIPKEYLKSIKRTGFAETLFAARRRPFTTAAAARKSSMRELVHEPMNTLSSLMSVMRVRGFRPM